DAVGFFDGGYPLGDDQQRGLGQLFGQSIAKSSVGGGIQCRKGVVEQVNLGFGGKGPTNRQPLTLSSRHISAALGNRGGQTGRGIGSITVFAGAHEFLRLSGFPGVPDLVVGRSWATEAQVRGYRTRK